MRLNQKIILLLVISLGVMPIISIYSNEVSATQVAETKKSKAIFNKIKPRLTQEMNRKGLKFGNNVYFRAFKNERILEVWVEEKGTYKLLKTFPICQLSGDLGPKFKEGDHQVPEGFYKVYPHQMIPNSKYHLAFNIGYPNQFDRSKARTGSYIMVHGACGSVGCLAMTDRYVEEIYSLAQAALNNGQKFFRIDIFPFRMTDERVQFLSRKGDLSKEEWSFSNFIGKIMNLINEYRFPEKSATTKLAPYKETVDFWKILKKGYDIFEEDAIPAKVQVIRGNYHIQHSN